jgi:hypothetical protein
MKTARSKWVAMLQWPSVAKATEIAHQLYCHDEISSEPERTLMGLVRAGGFEPPTPAV